CWAGPFAAIAVVPSLLPYLILAGIGAGNVTTYLLLKRYKKVSRHNNGYGGDSSGRGQFLVGLISLIAIPIVLGIYTMFVVREDIAVLLSRFSISFAYAVGGIHDMIIKNKGK
ncbi:MAG: hypothetical protein M3297_02855, partial [Thermoproteota archaeon]|nr:hypothetical protein [Thermoproteota archaeon]